MKYSTITINHHELPVNLMNADFANRLVEANTSLQAAYLAADAEHIGDDKKLLDAKVRAACAFFDAVFGEGTSLQIFTLVKEVTPFINSPIPSGRTVASVRNVLEGK